MSTSRLKIGILLLGIVYCMELFQAEASTEVKAEDKARITSEIPVSESGFTIVLRKPMSENPQVAKVYRDRKGNIKVEPIQGFTVSLPKNTSVFFMVDEVNTVLYDVKITVEGEYSQTLVKPRVIEGEKGTVNDPQERGLTNPMKYICVFLPKNRNAEVNFPPPRVVSVIPTTSLQGIKATVGPFVTPLRDNHYVNINNKIALGGRDQWSGSLGFLANLPIFSHNFQKFRWAFALSSGLAIGKISTNDEALSLGPSPVTFGGSFLFAGPTTDNLLSITGGGILKPVERLNGYTTGMEYPSDPKNLTKSVNRWHFFLALTFSYNTDISQKLL